MAKKINITGQLNAATTDGILADAGQIFDAKKGKFQEQVNEEFENALEEAITSEDTGMVVESIEEGIVHNALRKNKQILTEAEKYQARHNISAITAEEAEKIAQDKINEAAVSAPDKLQAVKELSSWLEGNPDSAATMNEKISENSADIQRLYRGTGIDEYSQFSTGMDYAAGDVVLYDGVLFRFKTDHAKGEWDYNEVEEWSEKKEREEKIGELDEKIVELTGEIDRYYMFTTNGNYENITSKIGILKKGAIIINRGVAFIAYKDSTRAEPLTLRTGERAKVDSDKRFILAGEMSGTIDFEYIVSEALINSEALNKELTNKIQVYDKSIGILSFDAKNYLQGYYEPGTGFVQSDYRISSQTYPISKNDIITVFPNGENVDLYILDTDGSNFHILNSFNAVTDDLTYESEYNGYIRVTSRDINNQIIRPDSAKVVCSIKTAEHNNQDIDNFNTKLSNKIQVYDQALDLSSFDTSEYKQGYYESGSGFVASDYVISSQTYSVNKGDVITVFPNGEVIQLFILDTDGDNFYILKDFINKTEEFTYKSEYNGFFRVVSRDRGQIIRPNSAKVVFSIQKSFEDFGIYKSVLTGLPVHIVNDSQNTENMQLNNASIINAVDELYPKIVRVDNGYVRYFSAVNMKSNHLVVKLRINRLDKGGYINVKVGNLAEPSKAYYYEVARHHVNTIIGLWQEYTIPCLSYQTPSDGVKFDEINDIFVIVNNGEIDVQYIGVKSNPLKKGIVTFTFDDGYTTQMDAAKMMCKKGVQGTYYVIKKAIDDNTEGYLTIPQLQQMAEQFNSDIQVHGNAPFDYETDETLLSIFRETQEMLKNNGISEGDQMSYPNGYHSERVVRLSKRFFKSCRTILQSIPIESYPPYDRYRMRSVSGIVDGQVEKIKEYIDRCVENNTWLILTFHKMEAAPSGSNDGMYCSMEAFEQILNYAVEKANVMSMSEVMRTSFVAAH